MSDNTIFIDEQKLLKERGKCFDLIEYDYFNSQNYLNKHDDNILLVITLKHPYIRRKGARRKTKDEYYIDCFKRSFIYNILLPETDPPFNQKYCYNEEERNLPSTRRKYNKYYPYKSTKGTFLFNKDDLLKILYSNKRVFYITPDLRSRTPLKVNCQGDIFGIYRIKECEGKRCLTKILRDIPRFDLSFLSGVEIFEEEIDSETEINIDEIYSLDVNNLEDVYNYLIGLIRDNRSSQFITTINYLAFKTPNDIISNFTETQKGWLKDLLNFSKVGSPLIINYILSSRLRDSVIYDLVDLLIRAGVDISKRNDVGDEKKEDLEPNFNAANSVIYYHSSDFAKRLLELLFQDPKNMWIIDEPFTSNVDINGKTSFNNLSDFASDLKKYDLGNFLRDFKEIYRLRNRYIEEISLDMRNIKDVYQYILQNINIENENENTFWSIINLLLDREENDTFLSDLEVKVLEPYINYDAEDELLFNFALKGRFFNIANIIYELGAKPLYINEDGLNSLTTVVFYLEAEDLQKYFAIIQNDELICKSLKEEIILREEVNGKRIFENILQLAQWIEKDEILKILQDEWETCFAQLERETEFNRVFNQQADELYERRFEEASNLPNFNLEIFEERIREEIDSLGDRLREEMIPVREEVYEEPDDFWWDYPSPPRSRSGSDDSGGGRRWWRF